MEGTSETDFLELKREGLKQGVVKSNFYYMYIKKA